ncbi:hypothetical protein D3C76_1682830 [compost metagenome]
MLVAPHAGQQSDPARAAQRELLAGFTIDTPGVSLAVVKPLLQVGCIAQLQILLQLHAIKADEQGLGAARVPGRVTAWLQGQEQQ